MSTTEPQITEIASFLATAVPNEGTEPENAKEAWRHSLRFARKHGAIDGIADMIRQDTGGGPEVERVVQELTR